MSINGKLAELCGMERCGFYWKLNDQLAYKAEELESSSAQLDLWNPTGIDLSSIGQLKLCYMWAEKDWDADAEGEGFESKFRRCLEPLVDKVCDRYTEPDSLIVIAWVKHPELVAQAILKAKGVS